LQLIQHGVRIILLGALAAVFAAVDEQETADLVAGAMVLALGFLATVMYWRYRVYPDPRHADYGPGNVVPHHLAVILSLAVFTLGFLANKLANEPALSANARTYHGFWHVGIFLAAWIALDIGVEAACHALEGKQSV
jgi:hypothetical protein